MAENIVSPEIVVTDEAIDEIMCDSFEGGVTYMWCSAANVIGEYLGEYGSEQISRGGEVEMCDRESDDKWILNKEKFLNGVKLWIEKGYNPRGSVRDGKIDTYELDAQDADNIVQLALFGEIVFG